MGQASITDRARGEQDSHGEIQDRGTFRPENFVKRIMEEKGLTIPEMSERSRLPKKTITYFLKRPCMTKGNRDMWFAAWARALGVSLQYVKEEMSKLFAHRYFPCEFCKERTFRLNHSQRFCSDKCRKKWRNETPEQYRSVAVHSQAFVTSYLAKKEITYTEKRVCESRDFQSEIDAFLSEGGTIKTLKSGFVEHQITIPLEDPDEKKMEKEEEIRVEAC